MIRSFARRTSVAVTVAGAVAFGAVALAPAASAATDSADGVDGTYEVVQRTQGNGPDAFLITDNGRTPIFFCDAASPQQRHSLCQPDPTTGGRF